MAEADGAAPHVLFDVTDGVGRVTLNRPAVGNSLSPEMVVRLGQVWDEVLDSPESIRVVILTGAGEKAFCTGADLKSLIPLMTHAREPVDEWDDKMRANPKLLNKALLRGDAMTTPVVTAAKGNALAGGFELLLATDLRVLAQHARVGLNEVRIGLVAAQGGTTRLPRQIPRARASEMLLLGEWIPADKALEWNLVNQVVPVAEVEGVAEELAGRMAQNGPLAMRKVKEIMLAADGRSLQEAFDLEDEASRTILRSDDAKEGARAFAEKRPPEFTGR